MTETVKKATAKTTKAKTTAKTAEATAAKAPKAVSKKAGAAGAAVEMPVSEKNHGNVAEMPIPQERIAELARKYWAERGYTDGHHEDDWYRAERELRGKAS